MTRTKLFSLEGRHVLVTGAAGHLGRQLCLHLLSSGAAVYATDVDSDALAELADAAQTDGHRLEWFVCDLSDESQRMNVCAQIQNMVDHLDGVVFAAAFVGTTDLSGWSEPFAGQSIATWRQALELNLTAPFHLTQLLEPLLRAGSAPSIVNVGSIYGSVAPDWNLYEGTKMSNPAAYSTSKGGLEQLTRWLSSSLAPAIRVNAVSLGGILRGQPESFVKKYSQRTPLGRMGSEVDAVGPILFLLSPAASYITGETVFVDGGYTSR